MSLQVSKCHLVGNNMLQLKCFSSIGLVTRKPEFLHVNNKDTESDQSAHLCGLISNFVFPSL